MVCFSFLQGFIPTRLHLKKMTARARLFGEIFFVCFKLLKYRLSNCHQPACASGKKGRRQNIWWPGSPSVHGLDCAISIKVRARACAIPSAGNGFQQGLYGCVSVREASHLAAHVTCHPRQMVGACEGNENTRLSLSPKQTVLKHTQAEERPNVFGVWPHAQNNDGLHSVLQDRKCFLGQGTWLRDMYAE